VAWLVVIMKHPHGPPMTLGNMREQGVHHLNSYCRSDAYGHQRSYRPHA
jgi:hypothetical protein